MKKIESVRRFERQLTDNRYLVLKFFMHIDREEQGFPHEGLLEEEGHKVACNKI